MLLILRLLEAPEGSFADLAGFNPGAVRSVEIHGGRAHLFHPAPKTAAVMLELDPLAVGAELSSPRYGGYAAGGILATAFGLLLTAPGGDDQPRAVEARLPVLWCPAGEAVLTRLFGPLGYAVDAARLPLDPERPEGGKSAFFSVRLTGRQSLADVVSHLRVLLPLFDDRPREVGGREAAELWDGGRAWLETHPERELIAWRLLGRTPGQGLHDRRHDAVLAALRESGARRVLDLGCGRGTLLHRLADDASFDEVVGVEVARDELAQAAARLAPGGRGRVLHGSLVYRDRRLAGFDAAALVEVIEHLDPPRLAALEDAVWAAARPETVVVTTPNVEYNTLFPDGARLRHPDHRFEWTRAEFRAWAEGVAARHGYAVRFGAAGPEDERVGPVTQMAVFERRSPAAPAGALPPTDAGIRLEDVAGERTIATRLGGAVHVVADEAAAALEEMSRFAVDPRWLVHLSPTLPAAVNAAGEGALEHPRAALAYYRERGVEEVALQELDAGTRVTVVVCRDAEAARNRFGAMEGETGAVYSEGGRPFFATRAAEEAFMARVRAALEAGGLWDEPATGWVALEGVIGPGVPVMREVNPRLGPPPAVYFAVAAAARGALEAAEAELARAVAAGVDASALLARTQRRAALVAPFAAACRRAFGSTRTPEQLRLAPVRLLASEGAVHADRDPRWHRDRLAPACRAAPHTLRDLAEVVIDLTDAAAEADATAWWVAALARGDAGIVVHPLQSGRDGDSVPLAPTLQCRGDDALRLVHGPEHVLPEQRERLRGRGIGEDAGRAAREWALSVEALERFVRGEPVARVHECVFAALALKLGGRA
ncbi:MAG TPA: methyltransferase [Longimicrobium sp.]|nr:methyltransferase [Longimicrobium sp.]